MARREDGVLQLPGGGEAGAGCWCLLDTVLATGAVSKVGGG